MRKSYLLWALSLILAHVLMANNAWSRSDNSTDHEIMAVLDKFLSSFNALDIKTHTSTYHFPHYRLASGRMHVLQSADDLKREDLESFLKGIGWHHSEWDKREISMRSEDKVHVNTRFTRYREDGSVINCHDSLYILTRESGKWAIKMRSSFAQ
ncbi:MAG: hypothetical protein QF921_03015 [Pseudomonadales bacterium]|jgi:hypothetical protein|nr:hypothetical protein [Pseudomonadales bacterium]MDP6471208.1 hypothetical protein [Pseudomonadales bacterium]MDP6825603.1 hypothetical protein [Pseudomonadales bacterium]MDP6970480.1 hypothetical protein [Pseudomonadales bacterium]|tara:strand:+ start:2683 stop:3144 length:462 start_codon:yes stop_codon:yes gene_type:complete